ncbi:zinc finger HIT domain-containing 1 [Brachionus plicatilis]|uniref:Zinc finger HIT domain-containing 1 n=1 Tax=Brachionus plicatilis TaxID=10195 RepID=A0A3M7RAX1_BRAPC|nr:zinc finger HIT domain-containing 1 [Brachionus plicatilis]
MSDNRESARLKNLERGQILDEVTRQRRQRKALEALERDNFQDDISSANISDSRLQINKKFQQRFTIEIENDTQTRESGSASNQTGQNAEIINSFINEPPSSGTKRKKLKTESRLRFRKNFASLLEEEYLNVRDKQYNYFSISVPDTKFPKRKFCSVCGFYSNYTCVQCGSRYCSTKCLQTHKDTRCLKWTA